MKLLTQHTSGQITMVEVSGRQPVMTALRDVGHQVDTGQAYWFCAIGDSWTIEDVFDGTGVQPWDAEDGILISPVEDGRRFIQRIDSDGRYASDEAAAQAYALANGCSYERQYLPEGGFKVYVVVDGSDDL